MLKRVDLTNFFSFRSESIDLRLDYNVTIGINGSGKSNFFKALNLLKTGVEGNQSDTALQDLFLSKYGGFDNVFCQSKEEVRDHNTIGLQFYFDRDMLSKSGPVSFRDDVVYKIVIKKQASQGNYFISEKISCGDFVYLDFYNGKGTVSERQEGEGNKLVAYNGYDPSELVLSKISAFDTEKYLPLVVIKRALKQINIYDYFDTKAESKLRRSMSATSSVKQLLPGGGNLPQILNLININHKNVYKVIQSKLRDVNPAFVKFDFNFLGGAGVLELMLEEEGLNRSVHAANLSDGTLRYLCLMVALFNPNKGKLICIDEPEVGLHPDMIYNVAAAIKEAAQDTMIILSTHSIELLNYFDLENIIVFEKNEFNSTEVNTYSKDEFQGWYDTFLTGKMWMSGDIGGKRW
ncbi:MAG: AAA family ATPase [Bacteroidota bacterium]